MKNDLKVLNFCSDDCSDIARSDEFFNAFIDTINNCRKTYNLHLTEEDFDNPNLLSLDTGVVFLWSVLSALYRGDI